MSPSASPTDGASQGFDGSRSDKRDSATNGQDSRARVGAGLALMLVAANQRTGLAAVPPLFEDIRADTGLDDAGLGVLSTLPIVAMGLLAPAAGALGRWIGAQRGLLVGALLVALGSLLRLFDPVVVTLMVGAVLVGGGITTIGTLMPAALVDRLPRSVGLWTGLTTFALALGATLAAALAIPLATWLGGWQASLAAWAVLAVLAFLVWLPMAASVDDRPPRDPLPWRSGTAWLVVGFTALGTAAFFAALNWTAATYTDAGLGEQESALILSLFTLANMVGGFLGPSVPPTWLARQWVLVLAALLAAAGLAGLAMVAGGAVPAGGLTGSAVAVAVGLGLGVCFGGSLGMLATLASDSRSARGLAALTFLVAYLAGAPAPLVLGWLAQGTGSLAMGWWLIAVLMLLSAPLAARLGSDRNSTVRTVTA